MAVTLYRQLGKGKARRYQKVNLGPGRRPTKTGEEARLPGRGKKRTPTFSEFIFPVFPTTSRRPTIAI